MPSYETQKWGVRQMTPSPPGFTDPNWSPWIFHGMLDLDQILVPLRNCKGIWATICYRPASCSIIYHQAQCWVLKAWGWVLPNRFSMKTLGSSSLQAGPTKPSLAKGWGWTGLSCSQGSACGPTRKAIPFPRSSWQKTPPKALEQFNRLYTALSHPLPHTPRSQTESWEEVNLPMMLSQLLKSGSGSHDIKEPWLKTMSRNAIQKPVIAF